MILAELTKPHENRPRPAGLRHWYPRNWLVPISLAWCLLGQHDLVAQEAKPATTPQVLLRITADAENLSAVTALAVGPAGILAVYQPQDGLIRFFDSQGRARGSVGRKGEGPGEFRRLEAMGWVGDTLWVSDPILRRLTEYGTDGTLLRMVQLPPRLVYDGTVGGYPKYSWTSVMARFPDRSLLFQAGQEIPHQAEEQGAVLFDPRWALHASAAGTIQRIIAQDPQDPYRVADKQGIAVLPLCPRILVAAAPDGSRRVRVLTTLSGNGVGHYHALALDGQGDTVFSRSYDVDLVPVPAATRDTIMRELPLMHGLVKPGDIPRYYPPLQEVCVAPDASVWIGLRAGPGQLREWQILNRKGDRLRSVWLPNSATPLAIEARGVWLVAEDEGGNQSVVLYRVSD